MHSCSLKCQKKHNYLVAVIEPGAAKYFSGLSFAGSDYQYFAPWIYLVNMEYLLRIAIVLFYSRNMLLLLRNLSKIGNRNLRSALSLHLIQDQVLKQSLNLEENYI